MIDDFVHISAKYNRGLDLIKNYLVTKSKYSKWKYEYNEVSNKSDIFISNECTRNALLKYLHKEIDLLFNFLNKSFYLVNMLIFYFFLIIFTKLILFL